MQSLPRRIRSETPDSLHFFRIFKEQPNKSSRRNVPRAGHSVLNFKTKTGGANRGRTGDLLLAKQALSQLSYGPGPPRPDAPVLTLVSRRYWFSLVGLGGL